jgi:hypothetical protein
MVTGLVQAVQVVRFLGENPACLPPLLWRLTGRVISGLMGWLLVKQARRAYPPAPRPVPLAQDAPENGGATIWRAAASVWL